MPEAYYPGGPRWGTVSEDQSRLRSFVAVNVTAEIRAAIVTLLDKLEEAGGDVRWVRPEAMHATLKFFGWVEAALLQRVHATLQTALERRPALSVHVRGLGGFPSFRRPRVVWVGLHGSGLVELAACIDAALQPLGFAPERRAFTPHITLGRVRSWRGWSRVEDAVAAHRDDEFGNAPVDAVTVYRSTLRPDAAMYTPLWTIQLAGNKGAIA